MGGCGIFSIYFVASLILIVVCPGVSPEPPDQPTSQSESELMEPPRDRPNVIPRTFSDNRSVKNRNGNSKRSSARGSEREGKRSTKTKPKKHLENKPVLTNEKSKTKSKSQSLDSGVSDLGNHLLKSLDSRSKSSNSSHFNNQSFVTESSAGKSLEYSDSGVRYQNSSHFINSYLNNSDLVKKHVNPSNFIDRSTHGNFTGTMKSYANSNDSKKSYVNFNDSMKNYVNYKDSKKSYVNFNDLNEKYKISSDPKEAQKMPPPPLAIIKPDVMSFPKIPVGSRPTRKQMYVIPASQTILNEPETPQEQSQLYSLQGSSHVSGQGYVLSRPSDTAHFAQRSKIASSERLQGFIVQHPDSYTKTSQHASPLMQQNHNSNRRLFPVGSLSQSALRPTSLELFKNRQYSPVSSSRTSPKSFLMNQPSSHMDLLKRSRSGPSMASRTSSQSVLMNQPSSYVDFLKRSRSGPSTSSRTSPQSVLMNQPSSRMDFLKRSRSGPSTSSRTSSQSSLRNQPSYHMDLLKRSRSGPSTSSRTLSKSVLMNQTSSPIFKKKQSGPSTSSRSSSQSVLMNQHSTNVDLSKSRQFGPSSYVGRGMDRKDLGSRSLEPVPPSQDMNFSPSLGHKLSGEIPQDWNSRDYRDDVPPLFMSPILKRLGVLPFLKGNVFPQLRSYSSPIYVVQHFNSHRL